MNMTMTMHGLDNPKTATSSRMMSLILIVLLHVGFFYAIAHGLVRESVKLLPKEVFLTLIAPETPTPPKQLPAVSNTPKAAVPMIRPEQVIVAPRTPEISHNIPDSAVLSASTPANTTGARQEVDAGATVSPPVANATPQQPKLLSAVEYLQTPQAIYPPLSRRMGEEGKVILHILVNERGHAEKVDVHRSSGFQRLDDAARSAVQKAIFKPYLENGKALPVIATATIHFSLES